MDVMEIKGQFNTAICYAKVIGNNAVEQIRQLCDCEFSAGSRIRIMPDVHAGKGCTIGTTMTVTDKAVPNLVGVDIGCGMYTVALGNVELDLPKLDEITHFIPSGKRVWDGRQEHFDLTEVRLRVPNSMTLMLNTDCATDCIYCYADRPRILQPISFNRIKELLKEAYDLGMPDVDVDGGDLFLYRDWRKLLDEMRRYDYVPNISTKYPLTQSMVDDLRSLGIRRIQLSIDSVDNAEMQQMLYVGEEYLGKVLCGLRLLDEAGIEVTVKPVITRFNDSEKSVNALIDTLTAFGSVKRIDFTPAGFSRFKPPVYYSTLEQLDRLRTVVEQRNRDCPALLTFAGCEEPKSVGQRCEDWEQRAMCTGNVHGFFVLPDGKATLCEQLYWHPFFIMGDLRRQSIMEMWNSEKALSLWNISWGEVRSASPCRMCFRFEECRRGLGNCWRKAVSAYGPENYDFPSPDCPKAPPVTKDYYLT